MNYRWFFLLLAFSLRAETRAHSEATIVLNLNAPPSVVLPLFGRVRDAEWAKDWDPPILYPADRKQIAGTVFTEGTPAVWVMNVFDEQALNDRIKDLKK